MAIQKENLHVPYSATSCIVEVRICTSIGTPPGPITAVCNDWYPDSCTDTKQMRARDHHSASE